MHYMMISEIQNICKNMQINFFEKLQKIAKKLKKYAFSDPTNIDHKKKYAKIC